LSTGAGEYQGRVLVEADPLPGGPDPGHAGHNMGRITSQA